jgi:transposase-like protein
MTNMSAKHFHDEDAAREHIEASRWPNDVNCPHCGSLNVMRMGGKTQAGYFLCRDCADKFTCRTGTLMERSHIPLHKWLLAMMLLSSSKRGMSAHQLHRMIGVTYKSAWFLCHRIREAMNEASPATTGGLGGPEKIVEFDETYVGGKGKNRAHRKPSAKKAVVTLIERDGRAASFHVANVTAETVRPIIVKHVDRKSALMTDESNVYTKLGREFSSHQAVDHSRDEYAYLDKLSGRIVSINISENFYSIFKRGITGVYH